MRKTAVLLLVAVFLVLTGCDGSIALSVDSSFPAVVAWNYTVYGLSVESIPEENIGNELGRVARSVVDFPRENGDSNSAEEGSPICAIKGTSLQDAVAVLIDGTYYKAYKSSRLSS